MCPPAQLVTYGDASFANMEDSKSSSTLKRVVRSTLAADAYSVQEAVEEAQWLRSVLAEIWTSVSSSLPRSLDSLRRPIATLSDSFNLHQAVNSNKGTGSDKRLRIVNSNA